MLVYWVTDNVVSIMNGTCCWKDSLKIGSALFREKGNRYNIGCYILHYYIDNEANSSKYSNYLW